MKTRILLLFTLLCSAMGMAQVFVAADATGTNDGSSWANAYTDLNVALANSGPGEFWVKAGTYTPGTSRSDKFNIGGSDEVYGGFNGTETMLSQRDFRANVTILSGDLNNNDSSGTLSFNDGTRSDNSLRVVQILGGNSRLDGFTISGGQADDAANSGSREGSGLYIGSANLTTVVNCVFERNVAYRGGAISTNNQQGGTLTPIYTIKNNIFRDNLAAFAPGIYLLPQNGINPTFIVENCLFHDNVAATAPDGTSGLTVIWMRNQVSQSNALLDVQNSTFVNNTMPTSSATSPVVAGSSTNGNFLATVRVLNSVFDANVLSNGAPASALGTYGTFDPGIYVVRNSGADLNFANITDKAVTTDADPLFVDAANDDFHLTAASPLSDYGRNDLVDADNTLDLGSDARIQDGTVDAGAYEGAGAPLCVVTIPDANFKTVLVANNAINTNGDSEIQCSEASAFTGQLNASNSNVADITGVEAFVNASQIQLSSNNISTADFSQNTAVTQITLNNNPTTSINIGGLQSLVVLRCENCQLSSIDVSTSAVAELFFDGNDFTTFNLSNNSTLTRVDLEQNNSLTSVNIDNSVLVNVNLNFNPSLTSISITDAPDLRFLTARNGGLTTFNTSNANAVEILDFRITSLASIDTSIYTALISVFLEDTQVASVDLSNSLNLERFFVNNNPNINFLDVRNGNNSNIVLMNALTTPNLTCINVSDVAYAQANFTNIDAGDIFSNNCPPPVCNVNIPDANLKAALIGNSAINTNGDSEIQCSEATVYTGAIAVSGVSVVDATGLEAFTNITSIDIPFNDLTSLDISTNTQLQSLILGSNPITSLTLGANSNLMVVSCGSCELSSIDFSGTPNITRIELGENMLTAINVSNLSNLREISIENNQVSGILDLSNNPLMEEVRVFNNQLTAITTVPNAPIKDFNARNNMLTALDVTQLPQIQDLLLGTNMISGIDVTNIPTLSVLETSNNTISSIDLTQNPQLIGFVSNNTNLSSLDVTQNPNLVQLEFEDNNVMAIDVTQNPNLIFLKASNNQLTAIDVTQNPNLENFTINNNAVGAIDLTAQTNLIELRIANTGYTSFDPTQFTTISQLDVSGLGITPLDLSTLANLGFLVANDNGYSSIDLTNNPSLSSIELNDNSLTTIDLSAQSFLFNLLLENNSLTELDLRGISLFQSQFPQSSSGPLGFFNTENNPALTCISVDDVALVPAGFMVDPQTSFSTNCAAGTNSAPNAVCQAITIQLDANGNATIVAADVDGGSNDSDGTVASISVDIDTFDCSNLGANTVTLTVTDDDGDSSTCTATVTVQDTIAPIVTAPANVVQGNDPGVCGAQINTIITVTDNCSATFTTDAPAGGNFPVGTTTVNITATDAAGNTDTASYTVTINDTENPIVIAPANVMQGNDPGICGAQINTIINVTDNCSATFTTDAPAGGNFPIGTTIVNITATDPAGNTDTANYTVTINDTEAPVITVPANLVMDNDLGECNALVNFTATATDNCGTATVTNNAPAGNIFPVGTTTVTVTAIDADGNTETDTFTVTVNDTEAPVIGVLNDITVANEAGMCSATIGDQVTATDNCSVTITTDAPAGLVFPVGTTTVNVTATDPAGNTATDSYTVTVNDVEDPTISCPANGTVMVPQGTQLTLPDYIADGDAVATDNCTFITTQTPAVGTMLGVGTYTITFEVEDASGNTATCDFELTVDEILGASDNAVATFTLYPNPATTQITIMGTFEIATVEVYNLLGQKVLASTSEILNIENLASAMYLVTITDTDGNKAVKRFIKE